jgi:1-deoxy-D-xylulose-5-phosphate synthase
MTPILNTIKTPSQLKQLSRSQLPALADELRQRIIEVVSQNGGHLAPSLGAVELTIALHYVFELPRDKIIFDVGHQAYAHKLLTGRAERFATLRQYRGLSGFPRVSESAYDAFSTGHASTSISAALGMTCAKDIANDPARVIAVIGDGAMTGGMAYEALNQSGDLDKNLLIILNDNTMSIAPNVGAISSTLSRAFSKKRMQEVIEEIGKAIRALPGIGDDAYQIAKRSKVSFKTFVTPGMLIEAFGVEYFGPIDGHNQNQLIDMLANLKGHKGPVLLHVKTKKGKDYKPAEKNPVYFHGCGRFDIDTGVCVDKKIAVPSYTAVFGDTLVDLAHRQTNVVAITAAMPEGTGLAKFAKAYPERFFDVGIAEQHAVTFAAGLATEGLKPVVAIYSTFLQRAYDQLLHDVCLEALPVVLAIDRGGIVGEDGPTHQGLFDLAYLRSLPNMTVMAPKDENELRHMLQTALAHDGPVAVRYPRGTAEGVAMDEQIERLPLGRAEILQEGADVLIVAIGRSVNEAMVAGDRLKAQGVEATVVNSRFVKPLDGDMLAALAKKIPRIVTVEENVRQGGFGSAVWECLNDRGIGGLQITRIGIGDTFVEHGPPVRLRGIYGVDAKAIAEAALELCGVFSKASAMQPLKAVS